jgi:hypothetical protein
MRTYVILGLFWLVAAGVVFWAGANYPAYRYTILGSEWSIAWLLLLFAAWNAVRWWMTRPSEVKSQLPSPKLTQPPHEPKR